MLEGYGLPWNPWKVEMCGWPNTGQTAIALTHIPGRLGHAVGHCHSTQPDWLMWKCVAFLAIPGRPCWVGFMRAEMWSVGMSMPLTTTDPTNCWKSSRFSSFFPSVLLFKEGNISSCINFLLYVCRSCNKMFLTRLLVCTSGVDLVFCCRLM